MITRHYFYIAEGFGLHVNGIITAKSFFPDPVAALERVRMDAEAEIKKARQGGDPLPVVPVMLVAFNRV